MLRCVLEICVLELRQTDVAIFKSLKMAIFKKLVEQKNVALQCSNMKYYFRLYAMHSLWYIWNFRYTLYILHFVYVKIFASIITFNTSAALHVTVRSMLPSYLPPYTLLYVL